jgi:predicted RNase H-like nuclease
LDAAWTPHRNSGVAIVSGAPHAWRCTTAVSSYDSLFRDAGSLNLIQAAEVLAGAPLTLAAVDMPLAGIPIVSRRDCDNQIARAFGACGCGVHSSTPDRPGKVSSDLMAEFARAGFDLAVNGTPLRDRQVIEVYPHIAVMRLLGEAYRVPYKIGRARQYWPEKTPAQHRLKIRQNFGRILTALERRFQGTPLTLPARTAGPTELKRFEDALDAIVCAWIGTQYLEGKCRAYGDDTASIWVPA